MKKYLILIGLLFTIILTSCNNTTQKMKIKNMNYVNGEYQLAVNDEEINLNDYIIYEDEYKIEFNNEQYSSSQNLIFKLVNGNNYFKIITDDETIKLNIIKNYECKITVLNESMEEIESFIVKNNSYLTEKNFHLDNIIIEGYEWTNKIKYSEDKINFTECKLNEVKVVKDLYIIFILEPIEYEITLKIDDKIETIKLKVGDSLNFKKPTKVGYTFKYWYVNGNPVLDEVYSLSLGNEFIACFIPNEYVITYLFDGLEIEQKVKYDEEYLLKYGIKEGYEFLYWTYKGEKFESGVWNLLENVTLTPVYKQSYIELNLETFGGTVDNKAKIDENGNLILPIPILENYKFLYWCNDEHLTTKVENINKDEYHNETLYAYYEYDSDNLVYQIIPTRYNKHANDYTELAIFDSSITGMTSLYWFKLAIKENNGEYYISNIAYSGDKLSSLGEYDYVVLAYSTYSKYKELLNMNLQVGYTVKFLIDPTTIETGNKTNVISFVKKEFSGEIDNAYQYLDNLYKDIKYIDNDINLVSKYNQYAITWETSNKNALSNTGKYIKPFVSREVTLTAYIQTEKVYSFTVKVKGNNEESKALATGYIYTPYSTITQNAMNTLDIIYCAFFDIDKNADWTNLTRMTNYVNTYIKDKASVAGTKIVISVNQGESGAFSSVSADENLREKLANNILKVIQDLELDGIDIDWETPSSSEATNFTLLMKAIYEKVKAANPEYLVTAAIGGGKWAPPKYDLPNSKNYLDYINLMTYSMATGNGYYQNSLYKSTKGATLVSCSIEESIKIYNDLTVPNSQILVGIPFYTTVQTGSGGPGSKTGEGKSIWYDKLFTTYQLSDTMKEYFDYECGVPYRYDEVNKIFISFDNEESIKMKCDYINTLGLAGIMYWQYGQDVNDMLSDAINKYINK